MEYRFSLTPRMVGLALFASIALLVILFTLGFQIGKRMANRADPAGNVRAAEVQVSDKISATVEQAGGKASEFLSSTSRPVIAPVQAIGQAVP